MSATSDPDTETPPVIPPPLQIQCRKCTRPLDRIDTFCRYCGTCQHVTDPFYYHPVWILLLAFFVLGPFTLGLVWRAQAMGRNTKLILAAIIIVYSAFSLYALYVVGMVTYRELSLLSEIM